MPNASLAESVLALFAGRERAAVIYGDLTEMAPTGGRVWFAAAYLRTLAVLSWRIVAAVVAGMALGQFLGNTLIHSGLGRLPRDWFAAAPARMGFIVYWLWASLSILWFLLPFAAVLYGVRDRFVRLAAMVTLWTTIVFLLLPWIAFDGAVVMLALVASTLLVRGWRRQVAVLAAAVAFAFVLEYLTGNLSRALLSHGYIILRYGHGYGHAILHFGPMLAFRGSMLAAAYLCARLHRWLLQNPNLNTPAQLAGGNCA